MKCENAYEYFLSRVVDVLAWEIKVNVNEHFRGAGRVFIR